MNAPSSSSPTHSKVQTQRKGWCPGALRPMQTGDGLLVRVKPRSSRISCATARELSKLSARHGNGILDLSQRANLQIRGITDASLPSLIDALSELGLLDDSIATETVRNILVSPLTGVDPTAADARAIVSELEAALKSNTELHALPGKFSFTIDAGGQVPLGPTTSDITLTAVPNTELWELRHAGRDEAVGQVKHVDAVAAIVDLAELFLFQQSSTVRRMRDLADKPSQHEAGIATNTNAIGKISIGDTLHIAAIGCAFGRVTAQQLNQLAITAEDIGCKTLILTPWRSIFVTCQTFEQADTVIKDAQHVDFITNQNDPRVAFDACPGRPACASGETTAMTDAAMLSQHLDLQHTALTPGQFHVSGCAKGCARQLSSLVTLVGRDGGYDLVVNGRAGDTPKHTGIPESNLVATVQNVLNEYARENKPTKGAR